MKGNAIIRKMIESDIQHLSQGFINQGWPAREENLTRYFKEQESGEREVLVAEVESAVAGYITILPSAKHGPFAEIYPELSDFNVFETFRAHSAPSSNYSAPTQSAPDFSRDENPFGTTNPLDISDDDLPF